MKRVKAGAFPDNHLLNLQDRMAMSKPNKAYLLLGSNIEPRFDFIRKALQLIREEVGTIANLSSVYESEPWGFDSEVKFLNCVVLVKSELPAVEILQRVLAIEEELGRVRQGRGYASRKIDIDILYFNKEVIRLPELMVPHPRLHERRFTLMPLVEVAPGLEHPYLKKTNKKLLEQLDDNSAVTVYKSMLFKDEI